MTLVRTSIPLYLPEWLHGPLKRLKHALSAPKQNGMNLNGDRDVEYTFVASRLPAGPGEALDFACGPGFLSLLAAQRGFRVTALDLQPEAFPWKHPAIRYVQGDLLRLDLPAESFDLVLNCSSVEHVGLVGRYGVTAAQPDGDLAAMVRLRELMKASATMLLTIPCGQDAVFAPMHRVYGRERLPKLLANFRVLEEGYWLKANDNRWAPCARDAALEFAPVADMKVPANSLYALACFVLQKSA